MSQAPTTTKLMTAEEFYDFVHLPENEGRSFDLVRGEVVEDMSRPGEQHGVVCGNVAFVFGLYVRQRKQGRMMCNDPGLILEHDPDTVRGPDVAYFETSQKYADLNPKWIDETPTAVAEVWSPNDRPSKMNTKVREYLDSGVKLVLVVYPEDRNVTLYRPDAPLETLDHTQHIDGGEVLSGFRCAVAEFFFATGDVSS